MARKVIRKTISTLTIAVLLGLAGFTSAFAAESASMSSSGADFEITPTSANPNGTVAVGEDKLTISSTCSSGYTLYMSSAEDETALKDADNTENTIPSTSGSISEPTTLNSPNHWGFALTSSGVGTLTGTGFDEASITSSSKFAGIPSSNRPSAIREKNSGSTDSDEISVYYAANAGTNLAPGNYSGSVLYTLVTPASCGYTLSFQADEENKDSAGNTLIGTVQSAGLTNEFKDPGSTINLNDYRAQYKDSSGVVKDLTEGSTLPSGSTLTRGFYLEGYTQTGWTVKELDSLTNDVLATNTYAINASSVAKTNSSADLVIISPIWTINRYTISTNTSTGIASVGAYISVSTDADINNSNINFGSTVSIKYTLTEGYAFKEWQITSVGTNQSGNPFLTKDDMTITSGTDAAGTSVYTFTMPASNVSLTAKAEGIKYNISFNNNTGSGTMDIIEVTYGDSATLPTNTFTAPEHYEFYGWSTSAQTPTYEYADGIRKYTNGQTGVFNLTTTAGATVPLYALWIGKPNTVTITKGDNVATATGSGTYRYGQTVNINATVTTTGYHWSTWTISSPSDLALNSSATTASNSFTMPGSAVSLIASAAANTYTIKYNANSGSGTAPTSQSVTYGGSVTLRTNTLTRTGYAFQGWDIGTSGSATTASYSNGQTNVSVSSLASAAGVANMNNGTINLYAVWKISASTTMQNFRNDECAALTTSTTANYSNSSTYTTRKDSRNNVTYTIRKYSDDLCWMANNLRLTPGTSDPGSTIVSSGTLSVGTSASQGSGNVTFADSGFNSTTASTTGLRAYYGGSATYGAYYTWSAANIVCPLGWTLPTSNQYSNFLSNEDISKYSSGSTKIRSAPYNFHYSGYYNDDSLNEVGSFGHYWASNHNDSTSGFNLYFYSSGTGVGYSYRANGFSVRCVHASS